MSSDQDKDSEGSTSGVFTSVLEQIASGIGLLLCIAIFGFIGWEAIRGSESKPPVISLRVNQIIATQSGHVVEIEARNTSEATAAAVLIEGSLKDGGETVETSQVTISFVPGRSKRKAAMMFTRNPANQLELRTLGYERP